MCSCGHYTIEHMFLSRISLVITGFSGEENGYLTARKGDGVDVQTKAGGKELLF